MANAGASAVSGPGTPKWKIVGGVLLLIVALIAMWLLAMMTKGPPKKDMSAITGPASSIGETGDYHPLRREVVAEAPRSLPAPNPAAAPAIPFTGGAQPPRAVRIDSFQATASTTTTSRGQTTQVAQAAYPRVTTGDAALAEPQTSNALAQRVGTPSPPDTAVAGLLPDRNLFLAMGTPIPCATESPIRTDVPGILRCKTAKPVKGASGLVDLLDPGTWAIIEIGVPMARGSSRAFGVVKRLQTPQGCVVNIASPIADQIGTAGLDGDIDTHFWERFQGYMMVAFLDMVSQTAALAASNALSKSTGGGNSLSFNQFGSIGGNLGRESFGTDQNIPPTLSTPQSRNIVVMSMQDIDMRGCFSLRKSGGR